MEKLQAFDLGLAHWFQARHSPNLDAVMGAITWAGDKRIVPFFALAGGLAFILARQRRTAACYLLACLTALLLGSAVKVVVQRPRPEIRQTIVARPTSGSFPSGHSLNSMAILGGLALVASRRVRQRIDRLMLVGLGIGVPLLIGLTRMYIGVHYGTDVFAGWTAGMACALLGYWMAERWGEPAVWNKLAAMAPAGIASDQPETATDARSLI